MSLAIKKAALVFFVIATCLARLSPLMTWEAACWTAGALIPWSANTESPTMVPIMAMTTSNSKREKAGEEETEDRKAETGNEEGSGNSRGGAEARRGKRWPANGEGWTRMGRGGTTKVGADRRDAPFLRRSLPS